MLAELAATQWDRGNAYFPPTTWQCSNIHAGTGATNVIPGTLELMFNFRYSTAEHARVAAAALRGGPRAGTASTTTLAWTGWGKPFLTPRGRLVDVASRAMREVTGVTPELSCTGGTSDGRFIADICDEVVELGPGQRDDPQDRRTRRASPTSSRCRPSTAASSSGCCAGRPAMSSIPANELETLRDWLRFAVSRFGEMRLAFGHGSADAYDEAAYLLLHALHLPLDRLEPFLDARLTQGERAGRSRNCSRAASTTACRPPT